MISRCTSSVLKDVFPRLLYSDPMCSQACGWCSQACGWHSQACSRRCQALPGLWLALPDLPPARPGACRCTWRPLYWTSNPWDMTTLGFRSDNSQTLPAAHSNHNTFCAWSSLELWNCSWLEVDVICLVALQCMGVGTYNLSEGHSVGLILENAYLTR